MNDKLPPEVRVKVAGECIPREGFKWKVNAFGLVVLINDQQDLPNADIHGWFKPDDTPAQWKALTRTAARLIEERFESLMVRSEYSNRLRHALSTDSVDDLERIVAELRGFL